MHIIMDDNIIINLSLPHELIDTKCLIHYMQNSGTFQIFYLFGRTQRKHILFKIKIYKFQVDCSNKTYFKIILFIIN